jgi:mycothiol system anti-sigma-R factor
MITCSEAVKRLWDYLEGEVGSKDRGAIEEHLGVCRRCCGELEFAQELRRFLSHHSSEDLPESVRARLVYFLEDLT